MASRQTVKIIDADQLADVILYCMPLQKHVYSNILKILTPKHETFKIKSSIFFIFLLKT